MSLSSWNIKKLYLKKDEYDNLSAPSISFTAFSKDVTKRCHLEDNSINLSINLKNI